MSGALDWLDNLGTQVGTVVGKAVDYAGQVAVVKATAGAAALDQQQAAATSAIQTASKGTNWLPYAAGGVVLLLAVYLIAKKA